MAFGFIPDSRSASPRNPHKFEIIGFQAKTQLIESRPRLRVNLGIINGHRKFQSVTIAQIFAVRAAGVI